jgi:hypothetical protein
VAIARREALKGLAAATLAAPGLAGPKVAAAGFTETVAARAAPRSVAQENALAGTREWMLTSVRVDPATKYRCPWVEGYASHASILPGQTLELKISTEPASEVLVEVFRLGYYGGAGGRQVAEFGPVACQPQTLPEVGERRLRNCEWPTSLAFDIPLDWTSGVYVAKLTEGRESLQSYIVFIVRDERPADLVFQCSDHTWHAYNRWPSQFSLYDDGVNQWHWGGAAEVSFNRPYGKYCQIFDAPLSVGSGEFFLWEFPFAFWLEREGYDVTYVSNTDTHRSAETARRGRGFLSIGHDEYWTIEMFQHVKQAIASGTHVGFFSGNAVCGRVEWNEATRSLRRVGVFGPPGGTREFESMSTLRHERPYANELVGAHSTGPVTGGADWICSLPDHWIYAQTGMRQGEAIPGVIGWEWHGDPAPIPGLEIVATGPTQSAPGEPNGGVYTGTVYYGPHGNVVFNAGTCWWADGLSEPPGYVRPNVYTAPQGPDRRIQQITRNVLDRMLERRS